MTVIAFVLSSCGAKNNSATENNDTTNFISIEIETNETTSNKTPLEVLVDAGLSQQLIDAYLLCNSTYTPEEYIQVIRTLNNAKLSEDQILSYFHHFLETYRPEEYITAIEAMVNAGLTDDQINRYSVFRDIKLETYINFHKTFEDAEDILSRFHLFSEYYSFEEYCNLISNLRTVTGEKSATPIYPLSDTLVFVKRNISTYDYVEESIAIMTLEGECVTNWNPNWDAFDIQYNAKCGDYFFVMTKGHSNYNCDVVNKQGKIIANISCHNYRYDIGEGYVFFTMGADFGQIMNPQGEVIELQTASVWPSYGEKGTGALEKNDEIGKMSEGLFYGYSAGNMNTVAYYYNTKGEVVIDLSTRAVNFKVTKLYDFSNGQAKIEFTGADYKQYYAYIDKAGAFVGEPVEITN